MQRSWKAEVIQNLAPTANIDNLHKQAYVTGHILDLSDTQEPVCWAP